MSFDWGVLGLELAQRSAEFSRVSRTPDGESKVIKLEGINAQNELRSNDNSPWWWPQIPLLKKLLEAEGDRTAPACVVSLGRHEWDSENEKSKPIWCSFVAEDIRGQVGGIKTILGGIADSGLLTSSALEEKLKYADKDGKKVDLKPLLMCFGGYSKVDGCYVADWSDSRKALCNGHEELAEYLSCCEKKLKKFAPEEGYIDESAWWGSIGPKERGQAGIGMRRLIAWMHFPYRHCEEIPWDTVLTVSPLWIPKFMPGMHAGAIIVYIRKGQWISEMLSDASRNGGGE